MSGLFGAQSPSASFNLFKKLRGGKEQRGPGEGPATPLPPGPASPVNTPMQPPTAIKARRRKLGIRQEAEYRTPFG